MEPGDLAAAAAGGVLIGTAASGLLLFNGRIAGISNVLGGVLTPLPGDRDWRAAFLLGLLAGGALLRVFLPTAFPAATTAPPALLAAAGLLVGAGAGLSNGCTSGHGVCGLSRGSLRSFVATLTFLATGALTVFVVDHVLGGASR